MAELQVERPQLQGDLLSSRDTRPCATPCVPFFFPIRSLPLASSLLGDFGPGDTASHLATGLGIRATRIDLELLTPFRVTYVPSLSPVLYSKPLSLFLSFHAYQNLKRRQVRASTTCIVCFLGAPNRAHVLPFSSGGIVPNIMRRLRIFVHHLTWHSTWRRRGIY